MSERDLLEKVERAHKAMQWDAVEFNLRLLEADGRALSVHARLRLARALIETGRLKEAERELRELDRGALDDRESREVVGLLGRVHKQRFMDLDELDRHSSDAFAHLAAAKEEYGRGRSNWHRLNLLLVRALLLYYGPTEDWEQRDGPRATLRDDVGAELKAEEARRREGDKWPDYWSAATAATLLALRVATTLNPLSRAVGEDVEKARDYLRQAVEQFPEGARPDSGMIWSTFRTFLELMDTVGPRRLLRPLAQIQQGQMDRGAGPSGLYAETETRKLYGEVEYASGFGEGMGMSGRVLARSATRQDRRAVVKRIPAVVLLLGNGVHATGLLVAEDEILTCAHVLEDLGGAERMRAQFLPWRKVQAKKERKRRPPPMRFAEVLARGCPDDKSDDWALLRLVEAVPSRVATPVVIDRRPEEPEPGDAGVLLHYPLKPEIRISPDGFELEAARHGDGLGWTCWSPGWAVAGSSGGPVFDPRLDRLLGLCSGLTGWRRGRGARTETKVLVVPGRSFWERIRQARQRRLVRQA